MTKNIIHQCQYCERALKSNAGKVRHENTCKARDIGGQLEDEIESAVIEPPFTVEERKVVQLEVMNGESTYYMGHPKRLVKLKGLMSRTHDRNERAKIYNMIMDLM